MIKRRARLLIFILLILSQSAYSGDFIFGVWSEFPKQTGEYSNIRTVLGEMKNTLHFNTVLNPCHNSTIAQAVTDSGMYIIVSNPDSRPASFLQPAMNDTTYYPRIYSESIYSVWESESNPLGPAPAKLRYRGGGNEVIGSDTVRHFVATGQWRDSTIQFGPDSADSYFGGNYYQKQFYSRSMITSSDTNIVNYHLQLRFKLGPRLQGTLDSDTIAVFYFQRIDKDGHGNWEADESYPGVDDPLIVHDRIVYIINEDYGSSATNLVWSDTLM